MKSYMTLDEVAEKLDLDKSEVQGLITEVLHQTTGDITRE